MTQLWTMLPPHSTCRLGDVTLANWKLLRFRTPHAKILEGRIGGEERVSVKLTNYSIHEMTLDVKEKGVRLCG